MRNLIYIYQASRSLGLSIFDSISNCINETSYEKWVKDDIATKIPVKDTKKIVARWLADEIINNGEWPESLRKWEWHKRNFIKLNINWDTKALIVRILDDWFN